MRPTVVYASTVGSPHQATLSDPIEMVQRRGVRYVMNIYATFDSVTDMLRQQSWDTHGQRRFTARVTMCFRITSQLVMIPVNQFIPYPYLGHKRSWKKFFRISASRDQVHFLSYFNSTLELPSIACHICFLSGRLQNQTHWSPAALKKPPKRK